MSAPRIGPRLLAGLVIVLTFVVGGLAGAVLDRTVTPPAWAMARGGRGGPPPAPDSRREREGRERGRERFVQQLTREVSLSPAQVAKIDEITREREQKMNAIWAEVRPRIHALLEETRTEVDQVLTPEQRQKMQELRRQHEAARQQTDSTVARDTTNPKR
jgi:Spy/CpxP family protein refolding chaperone